VDFRVAGLTLEKMGLAGIKPENLPKILRDGFEVFDATPV
jgi:hypothetical protein